MKIGIFTLPLGGNIGGILQAYALQVYLESLGHNILILDRRRLDEKPDCIFLKILKKIFFYFQSLCLFVGLQKVSNSKLFIIKYLNMSKKLYSKRDVINTIEEGELDAIIVGSDQIWRKWHHDPGFTDVKEFFLHFLHSNNEIIKIAYAASFGLENWEIDSDIDDCKNAVKSFKAISVRETSGIGICKKNLGIDVLQVLDPTMLITKEAYLGLTNNNKTRKTAAKLFCYILDPTPIILKEIDTLNHSMGITSYIVSKYYKNHLNICQWLRSFEEAEYVITDSYHGCVFSILFNKPFVVLGNKVRGQARFASLLEMFDLQNRLVPIEQPQDIPIILKTDINWQNVNEQLEIWRKKSHLFLIDNLI